MKITAYRVLVVILALVVLSAVLLYIIVPEKINIAFAITVGTSFLSLLIIYLSKGKNKINE